MTGARIYSDRLGAITDAQLQAVAERLNLGRFVKAEPITTGLFGQNLFLTTAQGEFVLRGAPHWVKGMDDDAYRREDRWQFTKEVFFAGQLQARTRVPVPWPMLHDETSDIFGWPYIVMPKMPGVCTDEHSVVTELAPAERRAVAVALGENLAQMQTLTWSFAGDFSPVTLELEPQPEGAVGWAVRETAMMARQCAGRLTDDDRGWIEGIAAAATGNPPNTYVHCDYKLGNLTLLKAGEDWRVGGLFDFHEARFADGALDVVRTACSYLDSEPALMGVFVDSYGGTLDAGRLALYIVNDRLKFWEYFTRPEVNASWLHGKTFHRWASRYLDAILKLI